MSYPAFSQSYDDCTSVGRRSVARLRLSIPAQFESLYAKNDVVLLDLSRNGARIAMTKPLARGEAGYLRIGEFEVFAHVVRCKPGANGGVHGLAFEQPLAQEDVLAVRHYADSVAYDSRTVLREQVRRWVVGEE